MNATTTAPARTRPRTLEDILRTEEFRDGYRHEAAQDAGATPAQAHTLERLDARHGHCYPAYHPIPGTGILIASYTSVREPSRRYVLTPDGTIADHDTDSTTIAAQDTDNTTDVVHAAA